MSAIPGGLDTDQQPPMTIPLRHFVVGFCFLLSGGVLGSVNTFALVPGLVTLSHVHLLLVGWVCLTIMGAMTQFVPVWSGVELHSRRLATVQLWLVTLGLGGFVAMLLVGDLRWLPLFGAVMLVGFWVFVYNLGRTLVTARPLDVTERHFALALCFFVLLTILGLLLAVDFTYPVFVPLSSIPRERVVMTHATLAVFGAVLTTIFGALYQLATMFTQTSLHDIDIPLRRFEEIAYPVGVVALALGRLLAIRPIAQGGGLLIIVSLLGFSVILARRLYETQVDWTPMLSRYTVVVPAMVLWAGLTAPIWLTDPLARSSLFGASGTAHLLVLGIIGFVVLGTCRLVAERHLSDDELRTEIKKTDDEKVVRRLCFVSNLYAGDSIKEASARVGASYGTGRIWLHRWNQDSPAGLIPRFGGLPPPKLSPQ